jgi:hypothetical protein
MITVSRVRTFRSVAFGFLCLAALVIMGCKGKGTVKGTIKYGDKKIRLGQVTFYVGTEHQSGIINDDGTYEVVGVPVGEAKVVVDSPQPANPTAGLGKQADETQLANMPKEVREQMEERQKKYKENMAKWVEIPGKYSDQEKTPLKYTVKSGGDNDFPIKIED